MHRFRSRSTYSTACWGPFANTATRAAIPIPFEHDPTLIGASFFVQGGTIDAAANALGIATSNGVAITIG